MDNVFNFSDIIKKGFIDQFSGTAPLTLSRVLVTLVLTFAIGMFIFYVYRKTFNGVLYTMSFNISLIMISLVTALIIMPISSNITLSLGMVGALSIVRFRTAIKDPTDIVFMFWSIAVGIATGAGFFMAAIVGSLIIGLILLSFTFFKFKSSSSPFLLVVHYEHSAGADVYGKLPAHKLKSKMVTAEETELTVEVRIKGSDTSFVSDFLKIKGVRDASLMSYNGDYVS
jgi:uncharacterized membrane protein YhiD involved in acid resistance